MTDMTITALLKEINENIVSDEAATLQPDVGDVGRQGDIYVMSLPANWKSAGRRARESKQLADGDTKGSRHIAVGAKIKIFNVDVDQTCEALNKKMGLSLSPYMIGPVVEAESEWTIEHPEHGDRTFPAGSYQICYQRSLTADGRHERAKD